MNRPSPLIVCLAVLAVVLIAPGVAVSVTDDDDALIINAGEAYTLSGLHTYNINVQIAPTGTLYVATYNGGANTGYVELRAPDIQIGGVIYGKGRGYRGGTTHNTPGEGPGGGSYPGGGGGYGGQGGASGWGNPGGPQYGTPAERDIDRGSGGARQSGGLGGNGGGRVSLVADFLAIDGVIIMTGDQGQDVASMDGGGGGSGGGIYLEALYVTLAGTFSADGGRGGNCPTRKGGGGGGGGRIKVFYCDLYNASTMSVAGGVGGTGTTAGQAGSSGTVWIQQVREPLISSIVDVENDQGRQVRIAWIRACPDYPGDPDPVTHYDIWRRIDPLEGATKSPEQHVRLTYPPGDWDFVTTVPARGEDSYNCVVPTLADSNGTGMHMTTFFVSGVTADPFMFYDSVPDSGYSVDNLAPAVPTGLQLAITTLTWDECPEADFDYFSVYGSATGNMGDAVLIDYAVSPTMDVRSSLCDWYLVTATDFNGNEGDPGVIQNTYTGVEAMVFQPSSYALLAPRPNPSIEGATICFDTPRAGQATLQIYDVTGRLVNTLLDTSVEPGRHTRFWSGRDVAGRPVSPGVYFVRFISGDFTATSKLIRTE